LLRKFGDNRHSPVDKVTAADVKNGTTGFKGSENSEDTAEASTGSPGAVGGLSLPPLNTNDAKPAETVKDSQPTGRPHSLTIFEGDRAPSGLFLLDKEGRVMNQDVTRSEVNAPARPPLVDRAEPKD